MALPDSGDVARMHRIIDRLRSYGVEVREMPGWETRGFRFPVVPTRIFDHHDASSRKSGEWGSLGLILDGTPRGIPGPLSNFQVARCLDEKPRVAVVAAGYCYHAGAGGPWNELPLNDANPRTYGTEKANDGLGEPYTAAANYTTNAVFHAAAVESGGAAPGTFPVGHKEWTTRKSDPLYSMADRRRQVATFSPTSLEEDMPLTDADITKLFWGTPFKGTENFAQVIHRLDDLAVSTADRVTELETTGVPATGGSAIDYGRIITGLADEIDRRARDGNPATGPAS